MNNNPDGQPGAQSTVVRIEIANDNALYEAYMPFILGGGLFISQSYLPDQPFELDTEVFLLVHLMAQDERLTASGRIAWLASPGTQRPAGIGIRFVDGAPIQRRIETLLAGRLDSDRPTHTL